MDLKIRSLDPMANIPHHESPEPDGHQLRSRKRKLVRAFSIWHALPLESIYDGLRFLDARNVQRLKMVNRRIAHFVERHDGHWPLNNFTRMTFLHVGIIGTKVN